MATDRTIPGSKTPEETEQMEATIPSSTALKDRYLAARGLEDSSYFHIGSKNGRNFAQFSTTPEGDAWTLAVVDNGTRYEMGIRPDNTGTLAEYALARKTDGTLVDYQARVEFGSYLDRKYPEPTTPTETTVEVVRGDEYSLLPTADTRTFTRTQAFIDEIGSGRADGDTRGVRPSRDPEAGTDGEPLVEGRGTTPRDPENEYQEY